MQQQQTKVFKGFYGWQAETEVLLCSSMVLTVLTMKRSSGKIETTAKVERIEGDFKVFNYGDFSARLLATSGRATEAYVVRQQEQAIKDNLPALIERVNKKYNLQPLPL